MVTIPNDQAPDPYPTLLPPEAPQPPPPGVNPVPMVRTIPTLFGARVDPTRLHFTPDHNANPTFSIGGTSNSNITPPPVFRPPFTAGFIPPPQPRTISGADAQSMLRQMGYVVTEEIPLPEPSSTVHPVNQPSPSSQPSLPSFGTPALARSFLANLFVSAAPPGSIPSLSQGAVVETMINNFFASLQGEKVQKPVVVSNTTERFAPHIANHPLPEVMTTPLTIGTYDGDTDPEDFLQRFEGGIKTQHWDDAVACHVFPTVLQSNARSWFEKLPPQSITSYADLRTKFLQQYHNLKQHTLTHLDCLEIKQMAKESLGEFITRYTTECQKIQDLPPSQQIAGFIYGIDKERYVSLLYRLRRKLPKTFAEAVAMARDSIRSGEDKDLCKLPRRDDDRSRDRDRPSGRGYDGGPSSVSGRRDGGRRENRRDNRRNDYRDNGSRRQPYDKHSLLSSLTKTPREILKTETAAKKAFNPPPAMEHRDKPRNGKYCDFHEEHGHDTDECRELKKEIKAAIQAGKLNHLLPGKKFKKPDANRTYGWQKDKAPRERTPDAVIHMIHSWNTGDKRQAEALEEWELVPISFPPIQQVNPSMDPVVITARIANCQVERIYMDTGSAVDVMYEQCFLQLPTHVRNRLSDPTAPLAGFDGETKWPLGRISLEVTLGNYPKTRTAELEFVVVRSPSRYNVLLGRPALQTFGAITSTVHGLIKFPTARGIATLSTVRQPLECSQISKQLVNKTKPVNGDEEWITINPAFPEQQIRIGTTLSSTTKRNIRELLASNIDVFAWHDGEMTGVPRNIAEHRLNVNSNITPVRQKKRGMAPERSRFLCAEVDKLVRANILREVKYQTWVANPVLVKKSDGSWRMCVDFKDINKACPKDNYPLPEIDWKVESLSGFRFKCFLDAYKGYHQVLMARHDEEKTAFHTDQGIFCYTKMPFGLKNAGATYQRVIDCAFRDQIGRNLEAYVDDIVIKSCTETHLLNDIVETFQSLRKINMKLNPAKCSFGVEEGKFLGHMVTPRGIKANPKKIQAIADMASPKCRKEVQSLNGRLAALTRFLSRAAERSLPFFSTLKGCLGTKDFVWTTEAESAFQDMKKFLAELPTLTAPIPGETLTLYIAASREAVSSVLIAERGQIQMPIYFVSKALQNGELNYSPMEKLALALVHSARRLRRYFQAHSVIVLTDQPIKQVLSKPETSGRMAKWAIELGEHDISFCPRNAIKGQVMADFLAELPGGVDGTKMEVLRTPELKNIKWELFTDGASSSEGAGAGLILTSPEGEEHTYALRFGFPASNNEAEYEALLSGMRIAIQMNIKNLQAYVDSQLVANQINGLFEAKEPAMKKYLEVAGGLASQFDSFQITQVPRNKNKKADALSKLASLTFAHLTKEVLVEILDKKSIETPNLIAPVDEVEANWMTPIVKYIRDGALPSDPIQARKIRMKAPMYIIIQDELFKKSFLGPNLRCLGPSQAENVIREVHEGSCALHSGHKTIAGKIMRLGYYWPSIYRDTAEITKRCASCQIHAPVNRSPRHDLIPVTSAWPFFKWGIDIVGPFPPGPGNVKFLIVAIDYFTKWVEAKPLGTINGKQVRNFVWDNIVCRFGIPHEIICDNGKQFAENPFKSWCAELSIKQTFTSVYHPQANGQVEVTNRDLVAGIKTRLGESRTGWVDELPNVLWAHRTTPKESTRETPFSLVYGCEAVIPAEISVPTERVLSFSEGSNSEQLQQSSHMVEERRQIAAIREASNKQKMAKYYNQHVRPLSFRQGDLVWRKNEASKTEDTGKLGPRWEGPYRIAEASSNGAYRLETLDARPVPRTWHVTNLKKCYV